MQDKVGGAVAPLSSLGYTIRVMSQEFSDAGLVLLGHGSTVDEGPGLPVWQHADELRRRGLFAEVRAAFWKQEPRVKDILPTFRQRRVFIVPLFISEGYFTDRMIPRELGFREKGEKAFARVRQQAGQTLHYCKPVGTHESMTGLLLARAEAVARESPVAREPAPSEITLFVAGHGTEKNEKSREAVVWHAERIRKLGRYAAVEAVFLEEEPRVNRCWEVARTRHVVVVPFFIGDGPHVVKDLPVLLGEPEEEVKRRIQAGQPTWRNPTERAGKVVWYASSVGNDPQLAEVILDRVREEISPFSPFPPVKK